MRCPEVTIMETCLGLVALSLAALVSGASWNRRPLASSTCLAAAMQRQFFLWKSHGFGMAIGLLILEGGACTVGQDPKNSLL